MVALTDIQVRDTISQRIDTQQDQEVYDYIIGCLIDESFEVDSDGIVIYENLGELMVSSGMIESQEQAAEICRQIAVDLQGLDRFKVNGNATNGTANGTQNKPIKLGSVNDDLILRQKISGKDGRRNLSQTVQMNYTDDPVFASTRDMEKLQKKREKEEQYLRKVYERERALANQTLGSLGQKQDMSQMRSLQPFGRQDIHLTNIQVSNGGMDLICEDSLTLSYGRKYGLVGRNGTGKSTFLRQLALKQIPGAAPNCQIVHVEQEIKGDDTPILNAVLNCDVERMNLIKDQNTIAQQLKELESTQDKTQAQQSKESDLNTKLANIYIRLEEINADEAESRAAQILSGLSFTNDMLVQPTKSLSGGWRMRVSLAQALFMEPDLLMLDEPTNHLDLHAVLWLQDYLLVWPKTLVVVSHARHFLDAVCSDIIYLKDERLFTFRGNYAQFEQTNNERVKQQQREVESQQRAKQHIQAFIDKFRYNAKRASLVQSRIKALERMADIPMSARDPDYQFKFPCPSTNISPPILAFTDVSFNYPGGKTLFKDLNFGIDLESKIAMVGANGAGKSTLLKLMNGELEPTSGTVTRNPRVRIATFSQHHVDSLDLALSPLLFFMKQHPEVKEQELRNYLGSFGVSGELATRQMYKLSGGQKSRVAFAMVTYNNPHLMLLDEPSNHLDMDAIEALIEGLEMYKGGIIIISHDQYLIESTVDNMWITQDQTIKVFDGSFEDYKNRLRQYHFKK